jgi:hypothetical protein
MYEPHCGHRLDWAELETSCVFRQLKQVTSREVSREMNLESLSKNEGSLRLAISLASSFSIE